jgi:hypothetical protein
MYVTLARTYVSVVKSLTVIANDSCVIWQDGIGYCGHNGWRECCFPGLLVGYQCAPGSQCTDFWGVNNGRYCTPDGYFPCGDPNHFCPNSNFCW